MVDPKEPVEDPKPCSMVHAGVFLINLTVISQQHGYHWHAFVENKVQPLAQKDHHHLESQQLALPKWRHWKRSNGFQANHQIRYISLYCGQ